MLRKLLVFFALAGIAIAQVQTQQQTPTVYVFAPPKSGGVSADLQITVQIGSGSTSLVYCNGVNCGGASAPSSVSFNPPFSVGWASLAVTINGASNTITGCISTSSCTVSTPFVGASCATSCTMRITNLLLNSVTGRLLNQSYIAGVAQLVDWDDVEMSGSVTVANGNTSLAFASIFQHCQNTSSCAPTSFACSSAWNGLSFKIWDSTAGLVRTVTMTDCTHLSGNYAGTSGTFLFFGLYDFTIPDGVVSLYAINSKKVTFIVRPAASSNLNISTPAYVTGTDFALSQVQTNTSTGNTVSTVSGSNKITFSGGNEINWAGNITIGGGIGTVLINYCVPGGIWGYTSTTCIINSNAGSSVPNTTFTWTPSPIEVCFSSSGYAGGLGGVVINGITYASPPTNTCQNTQLGSTPLRTAANPTGINVYYSFVFQQAYQAFVSAFENHYANNSNIGYVRVGVSAGGEKFPWAQTQMASIVPSSTVSDPPWTRYQYLANDDSLDSVIQGLGLPANFIYMTAANNCVGAGSSLDWSCADASFSASEVHGFKGIGSEGFTFSDLLNYAGFPCSGEWCKNFDFRKSCTPAPQPNCPAAISSIYLLELQQGGMSDPYNNFFGPGVTNLPVSAVRSKGTTQVTFTSSPLTGVKLDGTGTITLAGWDSSFNGTYQIVAGSAFNKTLTFLQPNAADATSSTVGWVGTSVFGSWTNVMPFLAARGANDIELYLDDALTLNPDPNDTYHSTIANTPYYSGVTLGATWLKNFKDFVANAIQ